MAYIKIDEEKCKGCNLCISVCPKNIIKVKKDKINKKGFIPACVDDTEKCVGCGFCFTICPDVAIEVYK